MKKKGVTCALFIIAFASFLLMGQAGCATIPTTTSPTVTTIPGSSQTTTGTTPATAASSQGLDFSLKQGVEFLSSGSKLNMGDLFRVGVHIENYGKSSKSGQVCIMDDIDPAYGGTSFTCNRFYVKEAQYDSNDKVSQPGTADVYFPTSQEYSFHDFPLAQQTAKMTVTLDYVQHSVISGSLKAPEPVTENLNLQQDPAALSVSVSKSIAAREGGYQAALDINFANKASNAEIWTTDFTKKAIAFSMQVGTYAVDCGSQSNIFDIGGTNLIKCHSLLPLEQLTHPVIITLDYGVRLKKDFSFTLQGKGVA